MEHTEEAYRQIIKQKNFRLWAIASLALMGLIVCWKLRSDNIKFRETIRMQAEQIDSLKANQHKINTEIHQPESPPSN